VDLRSEIEEREKVGEKILSELDEEGATFWATVASDAFVRFKLKSGGFPLEALIEKFGLDLEVLHSAELIETEEMKHTIAQIREQLRTGNLPKV